MLHRRSLLFSLTLLLGSAALYADISIPQIFSDHAVLQKGAKTPVWGKADPGEKVRVTLGEIIAETTTTDDGKWKVSLDLSTAGPGPYELKIEGKNTISLQDILVGEVWIASGQSNMGWHMSNTLGSPKEIANSANYWIREARVNVNPQSLPTDEVQIRENKWRVAGPETTAGISGICYYFAKKLSRELNTPVGILHSSSGGTQIEAWISSKSLDTEPELKAGKDAIHQAVEEYPELQKKYTSALKSWIQTHQRDDKPTASLETFTSQGIDPTKWQRLTLPGNLPSDDTFGPGATWIRTTVDLPQKLAGKFLYLNLPALPVFDTVYWNGKEVAKTDGNPPSSTASERRYSIPSGSVLGKNTLAIRLYNPASTIQEFPAGHFNIGNASEKIRLKGEWFVRKEYSLPPLSDEALATFTQPPEPPQNAPKNVASWLFNSMIHPIVPYGMRGVIWYQGESNGGRAWQYRIALPLLIKDWREAWGEDFPFYWVQLPNHRAKKEAPEDATWAELRDSMTASLEVPHTGQAITIDTGEAGEVHSRNKKDPAERLARVALAKTYGKDIVYSGPVYKSSTIEDGKIRVHFDHTHGGLVAQPLSDTYVIQYDGPDGPAKVKPLVPPSPGSEVQGFAICGEDGKWTWAQAKIDRNSVLVWSPDVPHPIAVRYAWADNPTCNLYNGEALPARPFRTDNFPLITEKVRYQIKETAPTP